SGSYLSSLPRTLVAGPVAADQPSLDALLAGAVHRLGQSGSRWVQLRSTDPALGHGHGFSQLSWEITYVLHLPDDPEQLPFESPRAKANVLRAVRKASRSG